MQGSVGSLMPEGVWAVSWGVHMLCLREPSGREKASVDVQTLVVASPSLLFGGLPGAVLSSYQQLTLFPLQTFILFWAGKLFRAILIFLHTMTYSVS